MPQTCEAIVNVSTVMISVIVTTNFIILLGHNCYNISITISLWNQNVKIWNV